MPISVILLAFGLAADAFAIAIGQGAATRANVWRTAIIIGLAFGITQAVAPLFGWFLVKQFGGSISHIDHWIAFTLLCILGGRLLWEGFRKDDDKDVKPAGGWQLVLLAIAVSLDAAAAGIALPTLSAPLWASLILIGFVTFVLSVAGVFLGRAGARLIGSHAEIVGGLILIGIAVKVLFDHRSFP